MREFERPDPVRVEDKLLLCDDTLQLLEAVGLGDPVGDGVKVANDLVTMGLPELVMLSDAVELLVEVRVGVGSDQVREGLPETVMQAVQVDLEDDCEPVADLERLAVSDAVDDQDPDNPQLLLMDTLSSTLWLQLTVAVRLQLDKDAVPDIWSVKLPLRDAVHGGEIDLLGVHVHI